MMLQIMYHKEAFKASSFSQSLSMFFRPQLQFWWQVGQMKTMDGEARSGRLYQLMSGLLCIPSSNADAERGFSVLRKEHTDERSSLNQSSLKFT